MCPQSVAQSAGRPFAGRVFAGADHHQSWFEQAQEAITQRLIRVGHARNDHIHLQTRFAIEQRSLTQPAKVRTQQNADVFEFTQ